MAGYDVFVSYAHEDIERVRRLDKALRELLRRPFRRRGFQVFRDEREISAGSDLTERILRPMRESRALVVVLSHASITSAWVDQEIAYWCEELGRAEHLILVRAEPSIDLSWDDDAHTFRNSETLPPALVAATHAEPYFVELGEAATDDHDAAVRIAASLLDRAPSEIAGEDYRLQRRRRRLAVSAATSLAVLTVLAGAASVLAVRSSRQARDNERRATADLLANRAIVESGARPDKALSLALAARRLDDRSEGRNVLLRLLRGLDRRDRFYRLDTELTAIAVSPAGDALALGDEDGGVWVVELPADRIPPTPDIRLESGVVGIDFTTDGRLVAGLEGNRVVELSLTSSEALEQTGVLDTPYFASMAFHRDSGMIAIGGNEGVEGLDSGVRLTLLQSTPGSLRVVSYGRDYGGLLADAAGLAFDRDGARLAITGFGGARVLSVPSLAPEPGGEGLAGTGIQNAYAVAFTEDGAVAVGGNPFPSNDQSGYVEVRTSDGADSFGTARFAQSVGVLTACRGSVAFGTGAGEYGLLTDPLGEELPLEAQRPIGDVGGAIRGIACESRGPLAIASGDGLVQLRDQPLALDEGVGAAPETALRIHVAVSGTAQYADPEAAQLDASELGDMATSADGPSVVLDDGRHIAVAEADRTRAAAVLDGTTEATANCLTADFETLQRFGAEDADGPVTLGRCGELELRTSGVSAATLELRSEGRTVATVSAGRRGGTFAVALSADARKLFVGGAFEGVLYDVSDPASPQEIVSVPADQFIGSASFAADGDVLVTTEYLPPAYDFRISIYPIDGLPLERLVCSMGAGSLEETLAVRVPSVDDLSPCHDR